MESILPFENREEAGRMLAEKLLGYRAMSHVCVLGLARGGVIIAYEIGMALSLPVFPYIVRKLGHPRHREFAVGALAQGGTALLEEQVLRMQGLTTKDMEEIIEEEAREMRRRTERYAIRPLPRMEDKTVILCDDGAATGASLFAAIEDMRVQKAKSVVVALPVSPPDTAALLQEKADHTVILATPASFQAVGEWYRDFREVTDEDVLAVLQASSSGDEGKES